MEDNTLPRLVVVGLILLTAILLVGSIILKLNGIETSDTLAATAIGALAGFLSRDRISRTATPAEPVAPAAPAVEWATVEQD